MQLKFQRSQRAGGLLGGTVIFCLDARADYAPAEAANIAKYRLGREVVYNSQAARRHLENSGRHLNRVESDHWREKATGLARGAFSLAMAKMSLNVSIASLGRGHHIECKDLPELLDAERALMEACRNVKKFLDAAATFNGSVILVDFDDGEKVHLSQGVLELAALPAPSSGQLSPSMRRTSRAHAYSGRLWKDAWTSLVFAYEDHPKLLSIAGAVLGGPLIFAALGAGVWSLLFAAVLVAGAVTWTLRRY